MLLEICSSKSSKTHTFERENKKISVLEGPLGIAATPFENSWIHHCFFTYIMHAVSQRLERLLWDLGLQVLYAKEIY
jgi:hypothetical protein